MKKILYLIRKLFILPIIIYQKLISLFLPSSCIYSPTCSNYSKKSIMKHGVLKGTILAITRISRCMGKFYKGGYDPVPEKFILLDVLNNYKKFWKNNKG